jgi:glycosyltransferase involved in cell wall biosynthesis
MAKHSSRTLLSLYAIEPLQIGGPQITLRELSIQLDKHGWRHIIVFMEPPTDSVREFLSLSNVKLEVLEYAIALRWKPSREFCQLLRRYRPEIVHLQYLGLINPYPLLARALSVKKVFITDQSSRPEGSGAGVARMAWKRLAGRTITAPLTRVFAVSEYVAKCNQVLGYVPGDRCKVLYDGVDLDRRSDDNGSAQQLRARYHIPDDRAIVLQVGWMIPEKGFSDLLLAAREVLIKRRDVHFVLVGEGESRPEFERLAGELGIAANVTFTGRIDDPMRLGIFALADVVCQLSRWEEGFGQTIAEAMACGKPLIGTRAGAIPELVGDGQSGFLVERRDVYTTAEKILALLADPCLRARMGKAGRQIAQSKFSLNSVVAELLRVYGIVEPRQAVVALDRGA